MSEKHDEKILDAMEITDLKKLQKRVKERLKEKSPEKKPKPDITCEVYKVFHVIKLGEKHEGRLQVVKWSTAHAPSLEYRGYYLRKDGTERIQRLLGMKLEVMDAIMRNNSEIIALLKKIDRKPDSTG